MNTVELTALPSEEAAENVNSNVSAWRDWLGMVASSDARFTVQRCRL